MTTLPAAAVPGPDARGRALERSVFLHQLLITSAMVLLMIVVLMIAPYVLDSTPFMVGAMLIVLSTVAAAVIPWSRLPYTVIAVLPVIDILAVHLMRGAQLELGAGLLLVFPVTWLATYFGRIGATTGALLAAGGLWLTTAVATGGVFGVQDVGRMLLLPIALVFVAFASFVSGHRARAQRSLLASQAALMSSAFESARREERTLDAVLDAVDFAVVAYDPAGRRIRFNEAFRSLKMRYGSMADAATEGRLFGADRITPIEFAELPNTRVLAGAEVRGELIWITARDNPPIALEVTGKQLVDARGAHHGSVIIQRNVTAELQALRARDDLIASVSHELRTPLTSILGYLELSLDLDELEDETRRSLEIVLGNSERMLAIVNELLSVARNSQHTFLLTFAPTEIDRIIGDAIAAARPVAAARNVTLTVRGTTGGSVQADGFRVRQVVDNLVSNAIKYNREGGTVTVSLSGAEDRIELRVADTGHGLSDAERGNLFQRYYRSESAHSSAPGTGLGLVISRDIVDQHGGKIDVASELDVGTIVTVTLPRTVSTTEGKTA